MKSKSWTSVIATTVSVSLQVTCNLQLICVIHGVSLSPKRKYIIVWTKCTMCQKVWDGFHVFHPYPRDLAPSECCRMLIYFAIFSRKLTLAVQVKITSWVANISWDFDCIIPQRMKHLGCGSQAFLSHWTSEDFVRLPKTSDECDTLTDTLLLGTLLHRNQLLFLQNPPDYKLSTLDCLWPSSTK